MLTLVSSSAENIQAVDSGTDFVNLEWDELEGIKFILYINFFIIMYIVYFI